MHAGYEEKNQPKTSSVNNKTSIEFVGHRSSVREINIYVCFDL